MPVSCIIFIISQTHANCCDFMASNFYFYIEAIIKPHKTEYQMLKQIAR